MVFGWGKKKKVEYDEPVENFTSSSQTITLDEIPKIAEDWIKKEKVELADLNNNEDSEVIDEDLKEEDQIENELTDDLQDIDSEVNEEELN